MNPEEAKRLGRGYMRAFQDQDYDYDWLDQHIAPEFVRHDDALPFEVRGPQGIRKLGAFMHGAFSEVELAVSDVIGEGDRVLVHLRMKGKHTGDFDGHALTGRRIDAEVMDLFRAQDGQLVEHWAVMDILTLQKQLGLIDA